MKKKDILEKILEVCTTVFFIGLLVNVTLQVFMRTFFPAKAPVWTEEASRFLFIFSVVFAAPLAMKKREYVNVDILLNLMPNSVRRIVNIMIDVVSIVLFAIVAYKGIEFGKIGIGQTSNILKIPMQYAYGSIAVECGLIMIYGIYNLVKDLTGKSDGGETL